MNVYNVDGKMHENITKIVGTLQQQQYKRYICFTFLQKKKHLNIRQLNRFFIKTHIN